MISKEKDPLWSIQKGSLTMFLAEVLGTAVLMFLGCMGGIGTMGASPPPPMQIALTFGLTINLIIMMLGHISGAHLNPAVTIGAAIVALKSIPTAALYCLAQFIGATIGYGALKIVIPENLLNDGLVNSTASLCVTVIHPEVNTIRAIIIEILCTGIILCTACATWDPRCANNTDSTALRIGFSVAAITLVAGPYTGCSMNPAHTFAPAFWTNEWQNQWVYWVGPLAGALLGTYTYQFLFAVTDKIENNTPKAFISEMTSLDETTHF